MPLKTRPELVEETRTFRVAGQAPIAIPEDQLPGRNAFIRPDTIAVQIVGGHVVQVEISGPAYRSKTDEPVGCHRVQIAAIRVGTGRASFTAPAWVAEVADWAARELEMAKAEALGMTMRGDNVDAWLKRRRDWYERGESAYIALDDALNDYRDHADTGTPLAEDVKGPNSVAAPAGLIVHAQSKMSVRAQDDQQDEGGPWTHGTRLGREHRSVREHLVEDHGVPQEQVDAWSDGAVHGHHDGVHRKTWAYAKDLPHPAPGEWGKCQCSTFPMAGGAADCPNHVEGAVPL